MEVIVPAAGLSSRFPNMKPKYLLYDYKHEMMLMNAVKPYLKYNVTVGILQDHEEKYQVSNFIRHDFGDSIHIVILEKPTSGPAETVAKIIQERGLRNESIFIKDCDSFFEHEVTDGNYVCVSNIRNHEILKKLSSKSFVVCNENGIITDIIEKNVVSDTFCVGGYKFESAKLFMDAFNSLQTNCNELFVSNVIEECLDHNVLFTKKDVNNYTDVGTAQDWFEYNDKPVIFCDIDGTLIVSQSKVGNNSYSVTPIPLQKNVDKMLEWQKKGAQIIFTTARSPAVATVTWNLLYNLGFRNFQLITGLLNSRRILINDFNEANPYPRAEAVNIHRNDDTLSDYL